jgi:hypothetical protein
MSMYRSNQASIGPGRNGGLGLRSGQGGVSGLSPWSMKVS